MSQNRGRPLPATTVAQIQRIRLTNSIRETARAVQVDKNSVMKYTRKQG